MKRKPQESGCREHFLSARHIHLVFRDHLVFIFGVCENGIPLKPVLGGVDSVALSIAVNEQSQSNRDCSFRSSFAFFASGRSYHQNLFIFTVAGVKCLCGGRKKSPRTSSLVQLSIYFLVFRDHLV